MRGRFRGHWWKQRFYDNNIRLTAGREIVLSILHDTTEHLSAADIYVRVHNINPSIGLTSVYRTLDMLEKLGLVQKFDFGEGKSRYELINSPDSKEHHHHLICTKCNMVIDYSEFIGDEKVFVEKTEKKLEEKYGFNIINHDITFYGVCKNCSTRKE